LLKGKVDPLVLAPKWHLALWRADPSFMNSVTGSGYVGKCSNILLDKWLQCFIHHLLER
jgi:hypothetical protein